MRDMFDIRREAASEQSAREQGYSDGYERGYEQGKKDAVVHGRWEEKFWTRNGQHVCSLCHKTVRVHPENVPYKFCPYCGGRMDENKNDLWEVGNTNVGNIAMDAQETRKC